MNALSIIIAFGVFIVLGAVIGLLLALASKVFHVEVDERIPAITECLPGANCGGCGFPGCAGLAEAIVAGTAKTNACTVGDTLNVILYRAGQEYTVDLIVTELKH